MLNVEGEVFIPSGATLGDLDAQIALKAPLISPVFTGTPTAPTQSAQDNSTKLATTAYVDGKMVRATAVNSTSGTSIDFTGIPSWAKRITVMFNGISASGASIPMIQLGTSSGVETTGYAGAAWNGSTSALAMSNGFIIDNAHEANILTYGQMVLTSMGSNTWVENSIFSTSNVFMLFSAGRKTLANTLDRIRITTVNGTDTFDAGQINIMYEG